MTTPKVPPGDLASAVDDTEAILERRNQWLDRQRGRLHRLLRAGAAGGLAAGLAACQPCLSQGIYFECNSPNNFMGSYFRVTAQWRLDASVWYVDIDVISLLSERDDPAVQLGDPVVSDATVIAHTPSSADVALVLQPAPGATLIHVRVPYECDDDPEADDFLHFDLDVSGAPTEGVAVTVWIRR